MKGTCEVFASKLCEGVAPAADGALAEHVGSCLDCFRLMTELRDLPRLEAALRAAPLPDPGEAFWADFPSEVWRAAQGLPATGARASISRAEAAPGLAARVLAWISRPMPAAFLGAACAAAVLLLVVRVPVRPAAGPTVLGPGVIDMELGSTDIAELDATVLQAVLRSAPGEDSDGDDFVEAIDDDEGALTPLQRLETLDGETLQKLDQALRKARI